METATDSAVTAEEAERELEAEWLGVRRSEEEVGWAVSAVARKLSEWRTRGKETWIEEGSYLLEGRVERIAAVALLGVLAGIEERREGEWVSRAWITRSIRRGAERERCRTVWREDAEKMLRAVSDTGILVVEKGESCRVMERGKKLMDWNRKAGGRGAWPMVCMPGRSRGGAGGGYLLRFQDSTVHGACVPQEELLKRGGWERHEEALNRLTAQRWRVDGRATEAMAFGLKSGVLEPEVKGWWTEWLLKEGQRVRRRRERMWLGLRQGKRLAGRELWFPMGIDFRGRFFELSQYVGFQSDESVRACIRLPRRRELTADGMARLEAAGPALWGRNGRIPSKGWLDRERAEPGLCGWGEAKKQMAFFGWMTEVEAARSDGKTDFLVRMDATSSACQIVAGVMGDPWMAAAANVCEPLAVQRDIYGEAAVRVTALLCNEPWFERWKEFCAEDGMRGITKKLFIGKMGGMTEWSAREEFWKFMRVRVVIRRHPFPFAGMKGPYTMEAVDSILGAIDQVAREMTKTAEILRKALHEAASSAFERRTLLWWRTLLGLPVVAGRNVRSVCVRMRIGKDVPLERREETAEHMGQAAFPNFVQSLEASILGRMTEILPAGFEMGTTHDGFFVHPNDGPVLERAYAAAYCDVMEHARKEILPTVLPSLHPVADLPWTTIRATARMLR